MKKKTLARILEGCPKFEDPRAYLEQYRTPADIAAATAYNILSRDGIASMSFLDLGCGTGMLSAAVLLMGAETVVGVDVDRRALAMASEWIAGLEIPDHSVFHPVQGDVSNIPVRGRWADIALMNPPFGSQKRGADRPFIRAATTLSDVVYSFHNSPTLDFVAAEYNRRGFDMEIMDKYTFTIPYMFRFHRKEKVTVDVWLVRAARERR